MGHPNLSDTQFISSIADWCVDEPVFVNAVQHQTSNPMSFEEVWVTTGPVYDEHKETLKSGVEIPDAFFKIIVDEVSGTPRVLAFVIDQDVTGSERFSQFLASVDFIEGETGLDFLTGLEDGIEDEIEAKNARSVW